MASSPPFQLEDQTDEDFFDKLVDEDFDPTVISSPSIAAAAKNLEGSDSDDAKAFANLSMCEDSGEKDQLHESKVECDALDMSALEAPSTSEQANKGTDPSSVALKEEVSDSSSLPDTKEVLGYQDGAASVSDLMEVNKKSDSGVKEVGWGSFYVDSSVSGENKFGSYSDFFTELEESNSEFPGSVDGNMNGGENMIFGYDNKAVSADKSPDYVQFQDSQLSKDPVVQSANGYDLNNSQYWDDMYPGWKYDQNTGQWYQVDGEDANLPFQGTHDNSSSGYDGLINSESEVSYLKQNAQSVVGAVAKTITTESVSNFNQVSQVDSGYPDHMVFDPQYPGWYYDSIATEWRTLDSYNATAQSASQGNDKQIQNGYSYSGAHSHNNGSSIYGNYDHTDNLSSQDAHSQGQLGSWTETYGGYNQQGTNAWQHQTVAKSEIAAQSASLSSFGGNQQGGSFSGSNGFIHGQADHQKFSNSMGTAQSYDKASQGYVEANGMAGVQKFTPTLNFSQQYSPSSGQISFSSSFYANQKPINTTDQSFQSSQQPSYGTIVGRSPDGRPPHALVTFGFGGKLIVMKENNSLQNSSFVSQDSGGGSMSVLNLIEVVTGNTNTTAGGGGGTSNYFSALCQQSFPGPLVGGSVGSKDINKWIDERIANCESHDMDYRNGEVLRLLLSLLKIASQHYGKLRSSFGTDTSLMENDNPESAVAKLLASAKKSDSQYTAYGTLSNCLQQLPSEGQMQATASEVQKLLVCGRKQEALICAQEGQLWGPALVIASQLGDQFYGETVKQMAIHQLTAGTPLRTLCLLIAGQPAEVFSTGNTIDSGFRGANMSHQQTQLGSNGMLDDWEENLAVITANRTKDDELVIIHLGDCLWKDKSQITAAHICYLLAEANFEPYSDTARMCLIGADHWKFARTYASPEAIQRTEFYEYSKILGNSQYLLLPFQPYKFIYANMLAEVGKISDALKYCQAVLKSLKTGRAPEVETWKQLVLSLEERIRIHQQGGYTSNLAAGKLVGKLLNFFDSTAHRVVGGLPPPIPSTSHGHAQVNEHRHQQTPHRVSASQSTMTMSSLIPSASMEPINQFTGADGSRRTIHNRSVSEPDFGRSPVQGSAKEETTDGVQDKAPDSGGTSRFRFGFGSQLLQKTVGLVLRPRPGKQAKLGETNKFHYDEKLKRWVEEGAEPPAEEAAPPPPPTMSAIQNGMPGYATNSSVKNMMSPAGGSPEFSSPSSDNSSGVPPIPSSSNQFSARGRMGVRSRYVDTFNQGRGNSVNPTNLFHSPPASSVKPAVAANAKFFIPAAAPATEQAMEAIAENIQEDKITTTNQTSTADTSSFQTPTSSLSTMQRFPSMDHIRRKTATGNLSGGPLSTNSRRAASWSGSLDGTFSPPENADAKHIGYDITGSSYMPSPLSSSSVGDDLHEVEL